MKRYWSGLVAAGAMASMVTLGAQQGAPNPANTPPPDAAAQPGSQRTQPPPSAEARTPNTITVSGCLESAPAASTADARGANPDRSAAGTTASATSASGFMLSGITPTATGEANRGAVGTTGAAATSYKLEGDTSMLKPHLNHRVQITGRLQSSAASPTGAERAAPGSTAAGPTLRVESVTMLASTCDAASATPAPNPAQSNPDPAPNTQKP